MTNKKYNPREIEKKWQQHWEENSTFKCEVDKARPKYYILDMFPYPSGAGLHVGHVVGYTGSDVIARYKRQKGFNVLHPMGWDSFGLPAEQYAIRTGTHPQITTQKNIDTYRRQLSSLGFSYDWSREFASSDPKYYKWTQWIFTKLYEKGLAYQAEIMVNYCPELGTVLSNEEVEDGKSVEGGFPIVRKPLKQWILKITAYADRLLEDLEELDWPEHLKKLQRNWIGKSEGMNIHFQVVGKKDLITCFTTRHDTLFGVTYLVIAPEHHLLYSIVDSKHKKAVEDYIKSCAGKSDLERTDLAKTKTGVFTGAFAINPINGKEIPIWVADYVLAGYGTGAVMAVPSDDERDREFSAVYDLPALAVFDEACAYIHPELCGLNLEDAKEKVAKILEKMGFGKKVTNYKLRDWLFSRQRYWGEPFPILHFEDGSMRVLGLDELPLTQPALEDFKPTKDGRSPLERVKEWVEIKDPVTGKKAKRETDTMPQWAGSCWYYLRFCDSVNDKAAWDEKKEQYWMPVDLYIGGVEHAVLHLLYARFWHKVLYDLGLVSTKEPFKCLRNQGLVTSRSYRLESGGYVGEEDVVQKEGEFFQKSTGKKLHSQIEKMSKSKLNGVSPDEMIEEFGADALRLYELFMTPFDREKIWQTDAVTGCKRFLNRVFDLVQSEKCTNETNEKGERLIHRLVKVVAEDLESLSFNTAIAKMMEFLNEFTALESYPKSAVKKLVQLLYPFAPHFGEECWHMLGEKGSITYAPFPTFEEKYLENTLVNIAFQVNGKLRGKGEFKKGLSQEEIFAIAKSEPNVLKFLEGNILRVIYVQDKLLNIVVQ
jgi:leucyl-tRNA synthetase